MVSVLAITEIQEGATVPQSEPVGEPGVVDANPEVSRHQVLLFPTLFFYSP